MSLQKGLYMNQNLNMICKDPMFQLNLAIWMTQPQPFENYYVNPIFYKSGLNLYSIEPLLALPLDIRLKVNEKITYQDRVRPDLILELKKKKRILLIRM